MADFKYSAKSAGGATVEGTISADTKAAAVSELRKKNLTIIRLDEDRARRLPFGAGKATLAGAAGNERARRRQTATGTRHTRDGNPHSLAPPANRVRTCPNCK